MKKVLLGVMLIGLAGCEDGSYFNPNTQQLKSDAVARVTATGEDFRVYEFTPQTADYKQCIFASASQKAGLVCFDKVENETKIQKGFSH